MLKSEAAARKDRTTGNGVVPNLQRRHFAFIAGVIAALPSHAPALRAQKRSTALAFADACGASNPRFDRRRFLTACKEE